MAVYKLAEHTPQLAAGAWVADSATVVGRVMLGEDCSVWYGTVIRGDNDQITVGRGTNIQDNSVLHVDAGVPMTLGERVTVGHQVMLHGCTVGDETLIGIQSVILNRARIGRNSIVGACSLVTEGKEFPDGALIMGSPAKVVRLLSADEQARLKDIAAHYVENTALHRSGLERVG